MRQPRAKRESRSLRQREAFLVLYRRPEMSVITDLFAGVPVSDLDASIDWYTRFFGRPPDMRVGEEILWEIDEHAWLFIEPNAARAGAGRITPLGRRARRASGAPGRRAHRARPDRDLLERRPPRKRPRSGRERDRVRRAARRGERVTSIGRNRCFVIEGVPVAPNRASRSRWTEVRGDEHRSALSDDCRRCRWSFEQHPLHTEDR
jgi:catechol 2,3-dioxygenase-like lactoylglutathione lyase family enzyme